MCEGRPGGMLNSASRPVSGGSGLAADVQHADAWQVETVRVVARLMSEAE